MKKINLIMLLVLCGCFTAAQAQYIVTKVAGKVKNEAGNSVRPGTQLKNDERLSWSSAADKLWVVMIGKGEKIISPSPKATSNNNLLSEVIMSSLHQDSRSGSLSGRGEIIEKIPDALHTAATSNGKIIIEQNNKFMFAPALYPQTSGVFFIEIDVPSQTPIIRTLKTSGDTLLVNYADFVTETINPSIKYSIGYHSKTPVSKSTLVATFTPYFDLTAEMEGIVANTVLAYQSVSTNKDAVRDSVYRNVYASSGKPNGILFTDLFNKYWATKGLSNYNTTPGNTGLVFNRAQFDQIPVLSESVEVTRGELPDNYSLRQYAPPIGDQLSTSSCTAWSTAYACRTITYAIQHGYSLTNQYDKIKNFTFAPDFVYNHIKQTADCNAGTAIYDALTFMKTKGDVLKAGDFICGKMYTDADLSNAQPFKIKDFYPLNGRNITKAVLIQRMKAAIASKHALPFGMDIGDDFSAVGPSGIWYPTEADRSSVEALKRNQQPTVKLGGHAMCVIGYNDNINNGSFEVMNSWGSYRGEHGFWWINYDDFYQFLEDVYSVADFDIPAPPVVTPEPVKVEEPVVIKPVIAPVVAPVVAVKKEIPPPPIAVVVKPKLKGALEFMLLKPDASFENIPVSKKQIGTRGQMVEGDKPDSLTYANFVLARDFHSGNQYKIKFDLAQSAYVYVIGMDKQSTYTLFPQKKLNESALINVNNATLYLPNNKSSYTLDNVTGKEKMCILVSKSPIDLDALNQQFSISDNNLYQAVRKNLARRLLEMKLIAFTTDKIGFDTPVNDTNVLAFFVEMNHLQ